ncbi:MAG: NADH-quinone oxidoreductase, subunit G, partial [Nitrospinaceae bacterium]|nr:NADH-quinone oxidoreductase, subunit G [Nitrospinaceae bacterium]NIR53439.1 NADH-quinone oxidoreductase, subunit G [Nitrospinaceae bacterium]NIS83843.1 NADH-quinone oxidoreductase, subunit G [Nitrospinaceae bacterium]NIT80634.1 NADH-quinone oxidoreductase, subunit G [Nitrospinaceae bacterium]NIU42960.1 NADH-quinone oxidoreductase, subunit G [Nitrospinaceae bacterium]
LGDKTDYITSFTVTDEISKKVPGYQDVNKKSIKSVGLNRTPAASANGGAPKIADETSGKPAPGGLKLRVATYLFAHDKILDDECHLAHHFQPSSVHLHEEDARRIGVKEGDEVVLRANGSEVRGEARISNRCNPGAVVVPRVSDEQGVAGLQTGTDSMNWVHVEKG